MFIVKVGRRWLNYNYLIEAEEGGGEGPIRPDAIRVTMASGREFDLIGPDAEAFRRGASAAEIKLPLDSGAASRILRVDTEPGGAGPSVQGG